MEHRMNPVGDHSGYSAEVPKDETTPIPREFSMATGGGPASFCAEGAMLVAQLPV